MDAQLLVVQRLEEKEGVLQSTLAALEKELAVRTQALELNKRKVRGDGASITSRPALHLLDCCQMFLTLSSVKSGSGQRRLSNVPSRHRFSVQGLKS